MQKSDVATLLKIDFSQRTTQFVTSLEESPIQVFSRSLFSPEKWSSKEGKGREEEFIVKQSGKNAHTTTTTTATREWGRCTLA